MRTPLIPLYRERHSQRLMGIPTGAAGVKATLALMSQLVKEYKIHPAIRDMALRLTANLPQKDYQSELQSIFNYVQRHIRYTRDIAGIETIQTPAVTLQKAAGDCDDKSTLLAALLESIGFPTRFRAMGFTGNYCHVITEVLLNGKWLSLDATEPEKMGWAPGNSTMNMYKENGTGLGFWTIFASALAKGKEQHDTNAIEKRAAAKQKIGEAKQKAPEPKHKSSQVHSTCSWRLFCD